jgi:hypothetical protein
MAVGTKLLVEWLPLMDALKNRGALFGAVGLATVCALIVGVGLSHFSAPDDFEERSSNIEQKIDQAATLLKQQRNIAARDAGSICHTDADEAVQVLRERVSTALSQNRLEAQQLNVAARPRRSGSKLAPIELRFIASGAYSDVLQTLNTLAQQQPEIFVDTADMTPKTSTVTIEFSGAVFCAT